MFALTTNLLPSSAMSQAIVGVGKDGIPMAGNVDKERSKSLLKFYPFPANLSSNMEKSRLALLIFSVICPWFFIILNLFGYT